MKCIYTFTLNLPVSKYIIIKKIMISLNTFYSYLFYMEVLQDKRTPFWYQLYYYLQDLKQIAFHIGIYKLLRWLFKQIHIQHSIFICVWSVFPYKWYQHLWTELGLLHTLMGRIWLHLAGNWGQICYFLDWKGYFFLYTP